MPISGCINLPGDKSISHRACMLASIAEGQSIIHNISTGEDVESTRICLKACGINSIKNNSTIIIDGGTLRKPTEALNCGNSGTTARLISGILLSQRISADFFGDKSLSKRPMDRIIEPLSRMGAEFLSNNGFLPFSIKSNNLSGIYYCPDIASAQIKSAILFAGLGASGKTTVKENIKTRDHTEIMLSELGANIVIDKEITINKLDKPLNNFEITVPGDPSSAAFFATLAALVPNSHITIQNILANPTRSGFFEVIKKMGVGVEWKNKRKECGECIADIDIYYNTITGIDITKEMIPSIIDEIPIISILATQADSPTTISGASELRVKESDRISAINTNLLKMGCDIIEKNDGLIINPSPSLKNTNIKTYGDHRIAMAFKIAGLIASKQNILDDESCINISFPEFNKILESLFR